METQALPTSAGDCAVGSSVGAIVKPRSSNSKRATGVASTVAKGSNDSSSNNSICSSRGSSEVSSLALSSSANLPALFHPLPARRGCSPPPRYQLRKDINSNSSSTSSSSRQESYVYGEDTASGSCSVPESEAVSCSPHMDLVLKRPLVNPGRLQTLQLCSRDPTCKGDGGGRLNDNEKHRHQGQRKIESKDSKQDMQHKQQKQHKQRQDFKKGKRKSHQRKGQDSSVIATKKNDNNEARGKTSLLKSKKHEDESQQHLAAPAPVKGDENVQWSVEAATADAEDAADVSTMLAASASWPCQAVYQYSFRVPDTRANMRPFGGDPNDRRVEAIARACDSEVVVDPTPIRSAASSVSLRRITIRAPDLRNLDKCCRMFDDCFPRFYASAGLGPDGRGASKVFLGDSGDDMCGGGVKGEEVNFYYCEDEERYISASQGSSAF